MLRYVILTPEKSRSIWYSSTRELDTALAFIVASKGIQGDGNEHVDLPLSLHCGIVS